MEFDSIEDSYGISSQQKKRSKRGRNNDVFADDIISLNNEDFPIPENMDYQYDMNSFFQPLTSSQGIPFVSSQTVENITLAEYHTSVDNHIDMIEDSNISMLETESSMDDASTAFASLIHSGHSHFIVEVEKKLEEMEVCLRGKFQC